MKVLQDEPHLRLQFSLAGCDRLRFALQLKQACVAVGRGDGVHVGVLVPNNIDRSWHVPLLYLLSIPPDLLALVLFWLSAGLTNLFSRMLHPLEALSCDGSGDIQGPLISSQRGTKDIERDVYWRTCQRLERFTLLADLLLQVLQQGTRALCLALEHLYAASKEALGILHGTLLRSHQALCRLLVRPQHFHALREEALGILDAAFLGGHTVCHPLLVRPQHFHALREELFRQFSIAFLGRYQMLCHDPVRLLERGEQRPGSVSDILFSHDRPPLLMHELALRYNGHKCYKCYN